ncbi:hypothetical protein AXK57_11540 [Tsukamurella pulmonis]|uniref:DUF1877 family protein n=1 Tax=Tsukamurella pulmonis TaxID=47312 RepID=UPI0007959CF8|nr:DUF1877 family protein [Tsukamurella pulmonis]KXP09510.1 hypothetical protein AXK57_11540 [Tsukamurella pulmonis]
MAVTQLLARIAPQYLDACGQSVDELDRLCSFIVSEDDYLDLNWSGPYIARVLTSLGTSPADVALVEHAWTGTVEVNPSYREPYLPVDQAPMAICPADVSDIAHALSSIDVEKFALAIPPEQTEATTFFDAEAPLDPRGFLAGHLVTLRDFYIAAAARRLAVIEWLD